MKKIPFVHEVIPLGRNWEVADLGNLDQIYSSYIKHMKEKQAAL